MKLDDLGLSVKVVELIVSNGPALFSVKKNSYYLPEGNSVQLDKKSLMRISIDWRGLTVVDAFFTTNIDESKVLDCIIQCPTKKTRSKKRYMAFSAIPDTLPKSVKIGDVIDLVCQSMQAYTGTNQTRVQQLVAEMVAEIASHT